MKFLTQSLSQKKKKRIREREREREEQNHNPTSKISFLKLLENSH